MNVAQLGLVKELDTFLEFWRIFPRKIAKKDAERAWNKLTPDQQRKAREAVPAHVKCWQAECRLIQHIPYPATWLNGERFEDEIALGPVKVQSGCCKCGRPLSGYVQTGSGKMCSKCWNER